jgi:hypothetical protein
MAEEVGTTGASLLGSNLELWRGGEGGIRGEGQGERLTRGAAGWGGGTLPESHNSLGQQGAAAASQSGEARRYY